MSQPKDDAQFAGFDLDPLLARVLNACLSESTFPPAPRNDLLPLVTYAPPIAAPGTPPGPVADLLRLNTGVPPTPTGSRRRLGLLAGDAAGFPNGRRVSDDVTDIASCAVAGGNPAVNVTPNYRIGDGVNTNDVPYQETFPYVGSHRADATGGIPILGSRVAPWMRVRLAQLTNKALAYARGSLLVVVGALAVGGELKTVQAYNELADGLCRKARNTGNVALFTQADAALKKSLELSPGNDEARKLQVVVLLGRHQFQEALRAATELYHTVPDDIAGWGLARGRQPCTWQRCRCRTRRTVDIDLRPGSRLGFLKAAAVRERFGDTEGAIEFLDEAATRTSPNDRDELAWIEKEKARLRPCFSSPRVNPAGKSAAGWPVRQRTNASRRTKRCSPLRPAISSLSSAYSRLSAEVARDRGLHLS